MDYGTNTHIVHSPLQLYEGDCDNDSECSSGLKCFDRSGFNYVPDCNGNSIEDRYCCIKPTVTDYGVDAHTDKSPLQICEGDCDNDSHCGDGLRCVQVDPSNVIYDLGSAQFSGCNGNGIMYHDYCVLPNVTDYGVSAHIDHSPLQLCEGAGDNDSECVVELKRFQRSNFEQIPDFMGMVSIIMTTVLIHFQ